MCWLFHLSKELEGVRAEPAPADKRSQGVSAQLKLEIAQLRSEKARAEQRAAAAVRDKDMILRLRSKEIESLKSRIAQLESFGPSKHAQETSVLPVEENVLPSIDLISMLNERLRDCDATVCGALRATMAVLLDHPMLPELLGQMSRIME